MSDTNFPLNADTMRLIAEIGFMGTESGQAAPARVLFKALQLLRPESTVPYIGLAMAALAVEKSDEAIRILREEALAKHPKDMELMAFLGLALQASGKDAEAKGVLSALLNAQSGADDAPRRMAAKLLSMQAGTMPPTPMMPKLGDKSGF
jgi:predicted Zn-dependent protease